MSMKDLADVIQAKGIDETKQAIERIQKYRSDRIMSTMWMLSANSTYGTKVYKPSGPILKIEFPQLLNELLNYKPETKMKKFKNRFAVTGDVVLLIQFETDLIKLGYKRSVGTPDIFNYGIRCNCSPKYITVGEHYSPDRGPGVYIVAMNNACSDNQFNLETQYAEALKFASECEPLFITADNKSLYEKTDILYGIKAGGLEGVSENGLMGPWFIGMIVNVEGYFMGKFQGDWKWFSNKQARDQYKNSFLTLKTEDGKILRYKDKGYFLPAECVKHFMIAKEVDGNYHSGGYSYVLFDEEDQDFFKKGGKVFSTRTEARDWIAKNKPRITTETGEILKYKDQVWVLDTKTWKIFLCTIGRNYEQLDDMKYFTTEYQASEYKHNKKPLYTQAEMNVITENWKNQIAEIAEKNIALSKVSTELIELRSKLFKIVDQFHPEIPKSNSDGMGSGCIRSASVDTESNYKSLVKEGKDSW